MIHPSSIVSPEAKIHPSATVGPWCIVEAGASIEKNVCLVSRVRIASGTFIGEGTKVYDGCILGEAPQDLKYAGEETFLEIGKNCCIREYCTVNRGTISSGKTILSDDVLLMAYVHVGHDCKIGKGAVIANACQLGGHVEIGEYATLGGTSGVQQKNKVGAYAFVGASLKVDRDVPPASRALGNPLRFAGLNLHALRRFEEKFPKERVENLSSFYRELYRSKIPMKETIARFQASDEPLLREFFSAPLNALLPG